MPAPPPRVIEPGGGPVELARVEACFVGRFDAMASPCVVMIDGDDRAEALHLARLAAAEASRIERKFSRYRADGVVATINASAGRPVPVDTETARLLDYAATCHELSDGLFDVTSGVLRRAWTFDGSSRVPDDATIEALRPLVGWSRVTWDGATITLPAGMEIDLGGLGKEYAVDRAAGLIAAATASAALVNFGGDLDATGPRRGGKPWGVGIDDPDRTGEAALYRIDLPRGGLATSGDARRYVIHRGERLGHLLDPRTGWPVRNAPRAVTVLAPSCLEAGTLASLACLRGPGARAFLEAQGVPFWIV